MHVRKHDELSWHLRQDVLLPAATRNGIAQCPTAGWAVGGEQAAHGPVAARRRGGGTAAALRAMSTLSFGMSRRTHCTRLPPFLPHSLLFLNPIPTSSAQPHLHSALRHVDWARIGCRLSSSSRRLQRTRIFACAHPTFLIRHQSGESDTHACIPLVPTRIRGHSVDVHRRCRVSEC